jgi:hypothetical protein
VAIGYSTVSCLLKRLTLFMFAFIAGSTYVGLSQNVIKQALATSTTDALILNHETPTTRHHVYIKKK